MSNYDFILNLDNLDSHSTILKSIKPNSNILEFGSANGIMTKYMKEQLNCEITIVEIDESAGKEAEKYALNAFIGKEKGDAENYYWYDTSQLKTFDYVLFADLLEHLNDYETVLEKAMDLLKDDGSILWSIPNMAYNGIIISLLNENFDRTDTGILDKTHKHFFTYDTLKKIVEKNDLVVYKETNLLNSVENSEFVYKYTSIPNPVAQFLRDRKYGECYQFVWELKKSLLKTSIIIPVFNKSNFTKSCLNDLSNLDKQTTEIILIDNGSTDNTMPEAIQLLERMGNLKYVRLEENTGFGKACNLGYQLSRGEYIIFLNNDIRINKDLNNWTNSLINECKDNNLVSPTGGFVDPKHEFEFRFETTDINKIKDINYLSGWCLAGKRSVFNKLIPETNEVKGPFDNKYFVFYEDTDLSFRAKRLNIDFTIVPIPVVHFGHISSNQLNTNKLYREAKKIFNDTWKNKV